MDNKLEEQRVEKKEFAALEIALVLKLVFALFELVGGVIIFFVPPKTWQHFILRITNHELITDPKDLVANFLRNFAAGLTIRGEHFLGIFLASHGIVKLFLIFSLLRKKLWAYPLSIAVFSGFIVYQMYEFFTTWHYSMLAISLLDLAIVILVVLEYNNLKKANK